jgi:hypothetical protein
MRDANSIAHEGSVVTPAVAGGGAAIFETRIAALPHGVVHFRDGSGREFLRGTSLRRHFVKSGDAVSFRVAWLLARGFARTLPPSIRPKIIDDVLTLVTLDGKAFPIASEATLIPFTAALKAAREHLKQIRTGRPAGSVESITQGEVTTNDKS